MEKKERIVWLDLLRVIAMMSIIFYHVAGNTLGTYNITGTSKTVYEIIGVKTRVSRLKTMMWLRDGC